MLTAIVNLYNDYMANGDPRVTQWTFMKGPTAILTLVFTYICLALFIGPAVMKKKKPFDVRFAIFLSNMGFIFAYVYFFIEGWPVIVKAYQKGICLPQHPDDPIAMKMAKMGWWFFFMKITELTETIFYVLQKKNGPLFKLQVIHHSIVPLIFWASYRIEASSYNYFFTAVNSAVHVPVYTYYALDALGPSMKKYLWWKKYLLFAQMVHCALMVLYFLMLTAFNCKMSKFVVYWNTCFAAFFFVLFLSFSPSKIKKTSNCEEIAAKLCNNNDEIIKPKITFYNNGNIKPNGKRE